MVKTYIERTGYMEAVKWEGNNVDEMLNFYDKLRWYESKKELYIVFETAIGKQKAKIEIGEYLCRQKLVNGKYFYSKSNINDLKENYIPIEGLIY